MAFKLESPAFAEGARIPARHTCEGEDTSPPLAWSGAPGGTKSFALLCEDPDAPAGTWRHWAVFDIPADWTGLDGGIEKAIEASPLRQGVNDFRRIGYGGPCPPPGHGTHHYRFRLLALSVERLDVKARPDYREIEKTARPHVLEETVLTGTYSR